jgi:hypothetical protein
MSVLLATLLLTGGSDLPSLPAQCTAEVRGLERDSTSRRLSPADWNAFYRVARVRMRRGLEVLPGMMGCPDLTHAAAELRSDPATRLALRRSGISGRDYVEIGWTLLVAYDPEFFPVHDNPVVMANIAFVAKNRAEIESLFHGR